MKLQLLAGITVVIVALSTPVFADEAHHEDKEETAGQSMSGMPMMDMDMMHEQMAKMQKTMNKIHSIKNMEERQKLMRQHMQEMHKGMGMMGKMSEKMPGKMDRPMGIIGGHGKKGMMGDDDKMLDVDGMMKRHKMMEQRMSMMQGMMGQMMEHMMQKEKMNMK